ncbi:MAG: PEP-CTERM sorting domain-containing protein, partial [Terriglobia bacterium]
TITSAHSGCPGSVGKTAATFTDGSYTLTAVGYNSSTSKDDLFVKGPGTGAIGSENGLGLDGTFDNEINFGQYIYLDFSNLASQGIHSALIGLGSLQSGEFADVCATTTVGTPGSTGCATVGHGTNDVNSLIVNFGTTTNPDTIFDFTVPQTGQGNFLLLGSVSATTTPEPGTLVLFGTALIGLGLVTKRFRSVKALR